MRCLLSLSGCHRLCLLSSLQGLIGLLGHDTLLRQLLLQLCHSQLVLSRLQSQCGTYLALRGLSPILVRLILLTRVLGHLDLCLCSLLEAFGLILQ